MNMPNNLIQPNNNQNSAVDIDLSALGQDKLSQSINAEPQEKPILEIPTEATIVGIKLQRDAELVPYGVRIGYNFCRTSLR